MTPLGAIPGLTPELAVQRAELMRAQAAGPVRPLREATSTPGEAGEAEGVGAGSFADVLGRFVHEVNQRQLTAGQTVRDLQSGQNVSLHQAMITLEEAGLSFQLMVEVRNKLLESYQELMRMQV